GGGWRLLCGGGGPDGRHGCETGDSRDRGKRSKKETRTHDAPTQGKPEGRSETAVPECGRAWLSRGEFERLCVARVLVRPGDGNHRQARGRRAGAQAMAVGR